MWGGRWTSRERLVPNVQADFGGVSNYGGACRNVWGLWEVAG